LSGPLADRFDVRVVVHRPSTDDMFDVAGGEPSGSVRARVVAARALALERAGKLNAALGPDDLDVVAPLAPDARALLRREMECDRLTGRGYHRVRRVARTVADVQRPGDDTVCVEDVQLALSLRAPLGRAPMRERTPWTA
jgi:magnesium chelatase family protein